MNKDHKTSLSLQHAETIDAICQPLFENTRVKYFSHCIIDDKKGWTGLSSIPAFIQLYADAKYHHLDIEVTSVFHTDQHFLYDLYTFTGKARETFELADQFGVGHFLMTMKECNGQKELFRFAGASDDDGINSFYMHNQDLLENFILYYKDKIQNSADLRSIYNQYYTAEKNPNESYFDFALPEKSDFNFKASKYIIGLNQFSLSKREIECLYWLNHGKTLEEIGMILSISRRTVKAHVDNSKEKLHCHTLFQLGQAYHQLQLWRVLDEDK